MNEQRKPHWKKFWFVWGWRGEQSQPPKYRHDTMASAIAEAHRLAAAHPGQPYIVLSAKCLVRTTAADAAPRVRWFRSDRELTRALEAAHPSDNELTEESSQEDP